MRTSAVLCATRGCRDFPGKHKPKVCESLARFPDLSELTSAATERKVVQALPADTERDIRLTSFSYQPAGVSGYPRTVAGGTSVSDGVLSINQEFDREGLWLTLGRLFLSRRREQYSRICPQVISRNKRLGISTLLMIEPGALRGEP